MSRQIIKWFLIWFCGVVTPILLYLHYSSGLSIFTKEFSQLLILESLVYLNLVYIVLLLNKIDLVYGLSFGMIIWLAGSLYVQFYKDIDGRLQLIHILIGEVVITITVHLLLKKRSSTR